jgi:hypothetical protein
MKLVFDMERRLTNRSFVVEISMIKQEVKLWDRRVKGASQINRIATYNPSCGSHTGC